MKVEVKVDKLALSSRMRNEVFYEYEDLPNYEYKRFFNPSSDRVEDGINKYEKVVVYEGSGKSLIVCNHRKKGHKLASPLYLIFSTDYYNKILYQDVYAVEQFFRNYNQILRVSQIHLALDLISKHRSDLYRKVIQSIKPGYKRRPNKESKKYKTTTYFGELGSPNTLTVYDKAVQMWEKGIDIEGDVCRIELRMRMHQMNNFIQTIDELAVYDWSFVYPKYYSFHFRTKELKKKIKAIGEDWRLPIWDLRDIMEDEYDMNPSNFYRDCLIDHPQLSTSIPKALSRYRWKNDVSKF